MLFSAPQRHPAWDIRLQKLSFANDIPDPFGLGRIDDKDRMRGVNKVDALGILSFFAKEKLVSHILSHIRRLLLLCSSMALSFSQEKQMSRRNWLWLQVLLHRFMHTY